MGAPRAAAADLNGWLKAQLAKRTLRESDEILDDARRVLWLAAFSGRKVAALRKPGTPGSIAADIAARLGGMQLSAAMELLEDYRVMLWQYYFPNHRPFDDDKPPEARQ